MKIWYQVISSPRHLPEFMRALSRLAARTANPGTDVTIAGTSGGGFGDQSYAVRQLHAIEIVTTSVDAVRRSGGYACYVMANSLDPGIDALREQLDIPVLSILEVGASLATMVGDRFGMIAPNERFARLYEGQIAGYGLSSRTVGSEAMEFNNVPSIDRVFVDEDAAAQTSERLGEAATRLRRRGAEVLLVPGPLSCFLGENRIAQLDGVPVIEMFGAAIAMAEAAGSMSSKGIIRTSRIGKYAERQADANEAAFSWLADQRSNAKPSPHAQTYADSDNVAENAEINPPK